MSTRLVPFVLPDLGTGAAPITATAWLAQLRGRVIEGDRLLEVMVLDAVVDIPAPASGRLVERRVSEDDGLRPGDVLGLIELDEDL
jgi:2-oxoisovalerate dehydrogenase E2 component (dihydrolipoyl transacylase)